jgi:hypothetical protein
MFGTPGATPTITPARGTYTAGTIDIITAGNAERYPHPHSSHRAHAWHHMIMRSKVISVGECAIDRAFPVALTTHRNGRSS